jgi:hypothetical protein
MRTSIPLMGLEVTASVVNTFITSVSKARPNATSVVGCGMSSSITNYGRILMATETKTEIIEEEKEVTYYKCDKCHGHFHDETQHKNDLNIVAFGATTKKCLVQHDHSIGRTTSRVDAEYEYLLCDNCLERAHDYLTDFF